MSQIVSLIVTRKCYRLAKIKKNIRRIVLTARYRNDHEPNLILPYEIVGLSKNRLVRTRVSR